MKIKLDTRSAIPLSHQMGEQIRREVAAGQLRPGDRLPSVRELALELLVNPNTVARVYRDLELEGLLETRRGQGTFIGPAAAALAEKERLRLLRQALVRLVEDAQLFGLGREELLEMVQQVARERAWPPREEA